MYYSTERALSPEFNVTYMYSPPISKNLFAFLSTQFELEKQGEGWGEFGLNNQVFTIRAPWNAKF